jgi:hypothetical protein
MRSFAIFVGLGVQLSPLNSGNEVGEVWWGEREVAAVGGLAVPHPDHVVETVGAGKAVWARIAVDHGYMIDAARRAGRPIVRPLPHVDRPRTPSHP